MPIDRTRARTAFDALVAAYDPRDPKIALKIEHTLKVADLADRIARDPSADCDPDLAWLCGLLHDLGRFEQVRRYHTFSDARSVSHAALSVAMLFGDRDDSAEAPVDVAGAVRGGEGAEGAGGGNGAEDADGGDGAGGGDGAEGAPSPGPSDADAEGATPSRSSDADTAVGTKTALIRSFIADDAYDDVIRQAVGHHSEWHLPDTLDADVRAYCDVLRDADKVDILRVGCECAIPDTFGVSDEEMSTSPLSDETVQGFYEHRSLAHRERHYPADKRLSMACFAYDLTYPESLRIADEQGFLWQLMSWPCENAQTAERFAQMEDHLRGWVRSRRA